MHRCLYAPDGPGIPPLTALRLPAAPGRSCLQQKESKAKQAERLAAAKQQLSGWESERWLMGLLRANLETCR